MKRYIALLRGINVGGKNKLAMSDLKTGFENMGYEKVVSHLNSGNIIFSTDVDETDSLASSIKSMIASTFKLDIPVLVLAQDDVEQVLDNAPAWWGDDNKDIYDNLIFMFPSLSYEEFRDAVGEPKDEFEKALNYKDAVFWSFSRKDYQKTNWWSKTASSKVADCITIRTANTVRKIARM